MLPLSYCPLSPVAQCLDLETNTRAYGHFYCTILLRGLSTSSLLSIPSNTRSYKPYLNHSGSTHTHISNLDSFTYTSCENSRHLSGLLRHSSALGRPSHFWSPSLACLRNLDRHVRAGCRTVGRSSLRAKQPGG